MTDKELLERMIDMADLAKYPFIAYVNPNEPQETKDMIKGLKENCGIKEVVENVGVDLGKVIVMKRTVFEFIETPKPLKPIFESTNTCNECYVVYVNHSVEEQIKHDRESLRKTIDKLYGKENAKR